MKIAYELGAASGLSKDEFHYLAYRYDAAWGLKVDTAESWLLQTTATDTHALISRAGWITALWRSQAGRVYATDVLSKVYYNRDPHLRAAQFDIFDVDGTLSGVWGLHDELVWVWGRRGDQGVLHRWNGSGFTEEEAPGRIVSMHGISPDLVFAVGYDGLIARWDGTRWQRMQSPTTGTLSSVFVASPEEVYACGPAKVLLEGSIHGWSELLNHGKTLNCVAKWKDVVWVGACHEGLFKLEDGALVLHKDSVKPHLLDVRGDLLASCAEAIAYSEDGQAFFGVPLSSFVATTDGVPPTW